MLPRFYVPDLAPDTGSAELSADEAHHLTRVLRLAAGDEVAVFDGRGTEWRARIEAAVRDAVSLSLLEPVATRVPSVEITLVQSVLKGEAMEDVIRDSTMTGVATIQPVATDRTTVKSSVLTSAADRWRRIALSSAKQCGTARLPRIAEVARFDQWLPPALPEPAYLLVEPDAAAPGATTIRRLAVSPVPARAMLLVGPEGGWTPGERDAAIAAGAIPLTLGPLTLRANAAALAATAALIAIWDE